MGKRPKPDDRRDNVEKIQRNINNTIENIEAAEDMMAKTDNPEQRRQIQEKNERRREALKGMREEIRDEALARERDYQ
ncbi:MAG: small acid-soluble spore protein Tlp [Clostridiaceae bacterium]|nr:small acid-soluble spore protein Tlp [Clostridiaceae bacterium]